MATGKTVDNDMRNYIRHSSCVPIDIAVGDDPETSDSGSTRSINVSAGGLAFSLLHPVSVGARITISMPEVWPDY